MKSNNHGSTFRMDAYAGDKKEEQKVESTFAYDAMIGGDKKKEEVTPVTANGENPVSGQNPGAAFRMDAYAGEKKEGDRRNAYNYDAIMGKK